MGNPVRQYIIVRNDMDSLMRGIGRAAAQVAHIANASVFYINIFEQSDLTTMYREWLAETNGGFGTTIVLGMNLDQMYSVVQKAKDGGFHAGIVWDPEYYLKDGQTTHFISVETGAFVFGRHLDLKPLLGDYNLLP